MGCDYGNHSLYVLLAGDVLEDEEAITKYLTTYWCNLSASSNFLTHFFFFFFHSKCED